MSNLCIVYYFHLPIPFTTTNVDCETLRTAPVQQHNGTLVVSCSFFNPAPLHKYWLAFFGLSKGFNVLKYFPRSWLFMLTEKSHFTNWNNMLNVNKLRDKHFCVWVHSYLDDAKISVNFSQCHFHMFIELILSLFSEIPTCLKVALYNIDIIAICSVTKCEQSSFIDH